MRGRRIAVLKTSGHTIRLSVGTRPNTSLEHGTMIIPELSLKEIRSDMHDFIKAKAIIAGSEFDFWFEGDDDIYDELYGHLSMDSR